MKLPNIKEVNEVATYYGISTKGNLIKWLKLVNENAKITYYSNERKSIRVCKLLSLLGEHGS